MRWTSIGVLLVTASLAMAAEDKGRTVHFAKQDAGKLPAGWKAEKTGTGEGSIWKVVEDDTAPSKTGYVLAQTAAGPSALFNLCIAEDTSFKDGEIAVQFKAVRGEKDQGGGLVWRYRDHNNYYIARMNPLEDNYRVYKVVAGKRMQLQTKEDIKVKAGEWHKLKIDMMGDHIQCYLDGEKILDAMDNTFPDAGKVGLWTKADAQTSFDDLKITAK